MTSKKLKKMKKDLNGQNLGYQKSERTRMRNQNGISVLNLKLVIEACNYTHQPGKTEMAG